MDDASEPLQLLGYYNERLQPLLASLLAGNEAPEAGLKQLQDIKVIDEPNLLDASLEQLARPAAEHLREALLAEGAADSQRVLLVAKYLYHLIKVRGYKTVVRFFPHQVSDLDHLLILFGDEAKTLQGDDAWELRYILLLWVSLVCLLPFDLARWDRPESSIKTSQLLVEIGTRYLEVPGKERDAAAIMIGKLLARKDVAQRHLSDYVAMCKSELVQAQAGSFKLLGVLQSLCELVKVATRQIVLPQLPSLYELLSRCDPAVVGVRNPLIRRYRIKLTGRLALLYMPRRRSAKQRQTQRLAIAGMSGDALVASATDEEVFEVPEEVEALAQDLLDAVEDADGTVRYSAAKHLARLVAALPASLAEQISDNLLSRFSDGVLKAKDGSEDLSNVSDATWQGICLNLAECARRQILPTSMLPALMPWLIKALMLDRRKGSRIVGAGVRDAAAYVIWALARAYRPEDLQPYMEDLARSLVMVACYDREIHIRRAASAAFQELVGRTENLVPHGIDLLHAIDFYHCGNRESAFLKAAPEAAVFALYRSALYEQLLSNVLRHYDAEVRTLGAQSLAIIARTASNLVVEASTRLLADVTSKDRSVLHGVLLGLAAIVPLAEVSKSRPVIVALQAISPAMYTGFGSDIVVEGSCRVLQAAALRLRGTSIIDFDAGPLLSAAGKKTSLLCHEAAADAFAALSAVSDVSKEVKRLFLALNAYSPSGQQFAAMALGRLDLAGSAQKHAEPVIQALLTFSDPKAPKHASSAEARRNGLEGLTNLVLSASLPAHPALASLIGLLCDGLNDYTSDQRGDVGSFIRKASMSCLARLAQSTPSVLSDDMKRTAICACLRMTLERIDSVREVAIVELTHLCQSCDGQHDNLLVTANRLAGLDIKTLERGLEAVLASASGLAADVDLAILQGAAYGINWSSEYTPGSPATLFLEWAKKLSETDSRLPQATLLQRMETLVKRDRSVNRLFVPYAQLVTYLLRHGAFSNGSDKLVSLLAIFMRGVESAKAKQRIIALADLALTSLRFDELRSSMLPHLVFFLSQTPIDVREHVSEALISQDLLKDGEEARDLLSNTVWMDNDAATTSQRLVKLLS